MRKHLQNNFRDIALVTVYLLFVVNGFVAGVLLKDHNFAAVLFIFASVALSSAIVFVCALYTAQVRKLEHDFHESGVVSPQTRKDAS